MRIGWVVVVAVASGCSKSPRVKIDVAAVNATVPPELQSELTFEQRDVDIEVGLDSHYSIAVPKQFKRLPWEKPNETNQVVRFTDVDHGHMTIGAQCDNTCGLRDWKDLLNEVVFEPILARESTVTITDDVSLDPATGYHRRVLIAKTGGVLPETTGTYVTWLDGGDRYWICEFEVREKLVDAYAPFAKACETMRRTDDRPPKISTAKPPPNFVDIPYHSELEIHVPSGTKRIATSSYGDAAFDDGALLFIFEPADPALLELEAYKAKSEYIRSVSAWLTERAIEDGWIVTYTPTRLSAGDPDHGVTVVRRIGSGVYQCSGIVREEQLDTVIAACTSVRPKQK